MTSLLHPWFLLLVLLVPAALIARLRRGAPAVRFGPGISGEGQGTPVRIAFFALCRSLCLTVYAFPLL